MKGKMCFLSPRLPSPPLFTSTPPPFSFSKEDEFVGTVLRGEVEKLHEERNMLLETIEDLKQTATTFPEPDTKVSND